MKWLQMQCTAAGQWHFGHRHSDRIQRESPKICSAPFLRRHSAWECLSRSAAHEWQRTRRPANGAVADWKCERFDVQKKSEEKNKAEKRINELTNSLTNQPPVGSTGVLGKSCTALMQTANQMIFTRMHSFLFLIPFSVLVICLCVWRDSGCRPFWASSGKRASGADRSASLSSRPVQSARRRHLTDIRRRRPRPPTLELEHNSATTPAMHARTNDNDGEQQDQQATSTSDLAAAAPVAAHGSSAASPSLRASAMHNAAAAIAAQELQPSSSPPTPLLLPKRGAASGSSSVDQSGANTPNSLLSPLVVHRSVQGQAARRRRGEDEGGHVRRSAARWLHWLTNTNRLPPAGLPLLWTGFGHGASMPSSRAVGVSAARPPAACARILLRLTQRSRRGRQLQLTAALWFVLLCGSFNTRTTTARTRPLTWASMRRRVFV